ncbi:hypothetical protein L211DRAFT_325741 [Terfezia boudieri ATCC MYA-4762]|uniref:Uncharacterized protein n=1 Tax=Terfezia boudieri ATCC MYA-4762 TaxID=1051890 RepID=A0A3N4LHW4_9PEZI|nr:hypothetical protein L211DRAFT_325741 [Terfezia boudieri ATCC MYA-4762]
MKAQLKKFDYFLSDFAGFSTGRPIDALLSAARKKVEKMGRSADRQRRQELEEQVAYEVGGWQSIQRRRRWQKLRSWKRRWRGRGKNRRERREAKGRGMEKREPPKLVDVEDEYIDNNVFVLHGIPCQRLMADTTYTGCEEDRNAGDYGGTLAPGRA